MTGRNISGIRKDYVKYELLEKDLPSYPLQLFDMWFNELMSLTDTIEVNAATLATADSRAKPSARVILIKAYDKDGFTFFTNYNSRKGQEMKENPQAMLLFYWSDFGRQVRIEGKVRKLDEKLSDDYFASRPEKSKISAIVSEQSWKIGSREELEKKAASFEGSLERPSFWGGYILRPAYYEFWQGRANRLHDRICYALKDNGDWEIYRISP